MSKVQYLGQCAMACLRLGVVVGDRGVRSPGQKPKRLLFHPGAAGEEKTGGKRHASIEQVVESRR